MQVDVERLRAEQVADTIRAQESNRSDAVACVTYILVPIVAYLLIRDAVYHGVRKALRRQDDDRLKAAEKAERAVQAQRQATPATATRSSASPRSAPPGASGTPRKA